MFSTPWGLSLGEVALPTAQINGFEMHYRVLGEGPPVLLAHGLMASIAMMDALGERADLLSGRGFCAISYDARGHGRSGFTRDPSHYSWFALAADMRALLGHLGIERAHVVGGSMGAGTGLVLTLDHPETVDRLVLIAPPPLGDSARPVQTAFGGFAGLVENQGLERAVEVAATVPPLSDLRQQDPQMFEWTRQWILSQNAEAVVYAIRGLLDGPPLPVERFREIRARTLIVAHPDDGLHPLASAEQIHRAIAGSRLVMAPSATYFQYHQDELMGIIAGFLRDEAPAS